MSSVQPHGEHSEETEQIISPTREKPKPERGEGIVFGR